MIQTFIVYGNSIQTGRWALAHCVNGLAARGADRIRAAALFQVPAQQGNKELYEQKKEWKKMAGNLPLFSACRIALEAEVQTLKSPALLLPCAAVTAEAEESVDFGPGTPAAGEEILMTGFAGQEGMLRIAKERREILAARFAPSFLRLVERGADQIFAPDSALFALYGGASSALHVGEGGVFGALWELARRTGAGLEADLKKIPVLQETVEVCELFHINPYQLTSAGCFLMTAPDGEVLREKLETAGIRAAVIGRLRPDRDKILRNGEEIRYIDRPAPDEIGKLWERERQEE